MGRRGGMGRNDRKMDHGGKLYKRIHKIYDLKNHLD